MNKVSKIKLKQHISSGHHSISTRPFVLLLLLLYIEGNVWVYILYSTRFFFIIIIIIVNCMSIVSVETVQMVHHMCFVYNVVSRYVRNDAKWVVLYIWLIYFVRFLFCPSQFLGIVGHFFWPALPLFRMFRLHKPNDRRPATRYNKHDGFNGVSMWHLERTHWNDAIQNACLVTSVAGRLVVSFWCLLFVENISALLIHQFSMKLAKIVFYFDPLNTY